MDVSTQIDRQVILNGSGSARPENYSTNRSLNYSKSSNSLANAAVERITVSPSYTNYKDSVGLFGAENVFIKVQLDIQNNAYISGPAVSAGYLDVLTGPDEDTLYYDAGFADYSLDQSTVNTFEPAIFTNSITFMPGAVVSVDLENLKTGNKYIDCWFDARLYTKDRLEHPYDQMFISPDSFFYLGFHARDTKRLPYNVRLAVGEVIKSSHDLTPSERRFLVS